MQRDLSIIGLMLFNATPEQFTGIHAALVAGLESGTLNPVVSQEMPLGDASRAHRAVLEPGAHGKIILIP